MATTRWATALALLTFSAGVLVAADAPADPATLLADRGKLQFTDNLDQPLGKGWKAGKGKWEIADGVLKSSEIKDDMHNAVARHNLTGTNFVIQYSFRFDGAKQTALSINDARGHCCRVLITPTGITVQKDSHDKNVADKAIVLERVPVAIKPGEWHTVVVELQGKDLLARLDGNTIAYGSHDSFDVGKANFGLTVSGESVSFKNLRVWEATASKTGEAAKSKLLQERAKAGAK